MRATLAKPMIPVLYRASFGYLMRHPWQLAMALIGICIGVAVMVSVDLANESARRAFLMSMDTVNGEATHQIVAGPAGVDEQLYVRLRVQHGLRNIAPVVEGYVDVGDTTLHLLGVDMFAERDFRGYALQDLNELQVVEDRGDGPDAQTETRNGSRGDVLLRLLTERGTVLMSSGAAASLGLSAGATFDVMVDGKVVKANVAALIGADADRGLGDLLIADIATAQQWLGHARRLSRIDVRIAEQAGRDLAGTRIERIKAALPQGTLLLPAAARTRSIGEMSDAFMTNLTAMSLLAMLIGIFLIYNSVSFAVLQRRSLIGVLRALGLTRRQTFRLLVLEALTLGIAGATLGLGLGIWLGGKLLVLVSQSINDLYFVVNVTDVAVSPLSMFRGFAAGLAATLVAAAVPAWEAASFPPSLALARSSLERRSGKLAPLVAISGAAVVLLALVLLRVSGNGLVAGLIAVFMLILGMALCIPIAVRGSSRRSAPIASRLGGTSARLAVAGVDASLSRTGVAIVALAVAVSATIGVSIMVDSFRSSVGDWLENTLRSDLYVGVSRGTLDAALVDDLLRLPGIVDHSSSRRVWLESESGRIRLTAIDMARESYAGADLEGGDPESTWRAFEQQGAVLVSGSYAYRHGVGPGDQVSLPTPAGERPFPIAGTYRSYDADLDALLMSRKTYDSVWDDPAIGSLGIYLHDDADARAVMQQMRELSNGRQALVISSNRELRERSMQIFDRTFVITNVLYWLAVGVAAVGILGAMLALQLERARELAVFRALGMTPGQLGCMVIMQTGFIGLLSGIAAIPLGLVMAWVLIDVINRRAFGWHMDIAISPAVLLTAVALAVIASLAAGLYPAWRAAQAKPALAMREE
ncbi:MAG: FtsX-like permease family protein [Woeseia sp.]